MKMPLLIKKISFNTYLYVHPFYGLTNAQPIMYSLKTFDIKQAQTELIVVENIYPRFTYWSKTGIPKPK